MRAFYFNTGVTPNNNPNLFGEFQVWRNGTKQVIFYCEGVPDNARFMLACNDPELEESKASDVIVRPIIKGGLLSKYAYFKTN